MVSHACLQYIYLIILQSTLPIVTPFGHNANYEKMVTIERCDYKESQFLMLYYCNGHGGENEKCDYREHFHMM